MKQPAVYLLASQRNGTLYIGVSSNPAKRIWQHKSDVVGGFTKKYRVHMLVHIELFGDMASAIAREKRLKKWKRAWKIDLIEQSNPHWRDLYSQLFLSSTALERSTTGHDSL